MGEEAKGKEVIRLTSTLIEASIEDKEHFEALKKFLSSKKFDIRIEINPELPDIETEEVLKNYLLSCLVGLKNMIVEGRIQ